MDLIKIVNVCISIVLPVYNSEESVENAIRSVLQQSYSNYELIVVDDGSTDGTSKIINKFKNEEKIRIIKKTNGGVSSARNVGLDNANGDYLMFLDSDDQLSSNCLESLVYYINIYKDIDLIIFSWKEQGTENRIRRVTDKKYFIDTDACINKIIKTNYECGGGYPWNKVWRVKTIKEQNVIPKFNEELVLCEDKEWAVRLLLSCKRILLVPDILYLYYVSENEHLSKIDFNIVEHKNNRKIMSFMKASVNINQVISERKPKLKICVSKQCMQDIILVCFKAIKNKNGALLDQAMPYYKRYVRKQKKNIGIKYWVMLGYIYISIFVFRNHI